MIGSLAARAARRASMWPSSPATRTSSRLVDDRIQIFNPRDDGAWFDAAGVREKFGVRPDQVVDVLALMGDASDNVKGVPGIGEKSARALLTEFGTLDRLLEHAAELPKKKLRSALTKHAEDARRSRELVRIRIDVPVDADPTRYRYQGADRERCFALFSALGFKSLLNEFAPTAATVPTDYRTVTTVAELETLAAALSAAGRCGLHVLTVAGTPSREGPRRTRVLDPSTSRPIRPLRRPGPGPVGQSRCGHRPRDPAADSRRSGDPHRRTRPEADDAVARRARSPASGPRARHDARELSAGRHANRADPRDGGPGAHRIPGGDGGGGAGKGAKAPDFDRLPPETVLAYACERADLPLQAADPLTEALAGEQLLTLYRDLEHPLIPVLEGIERAGVRVATGALAEQSRAMQARLESLQSRIFALAGEEFNVNSPRQLSVILFEKLALPTRKKTGKTRAASTSVDVLEELALQHELPQLVLEWRDESRSSRAPTWRPSPNWRGRTRAGCTPRSIRRSRQPAG